MEGTSTWITSGVIGVVGILGLFVASRASDQAFYYGGFIIAAVAVTTIFRNIRRHYDRLDSEAHRHDAGNTPAS